MLLEYFELPFLGADIILLLKKYSFCVKENVTCRSVELIILVKRSSRKDMWVWLCDSNSCKERKMKYLEKGFTEFFKNCLS